MGLFDFIIGALAQFHFHLSTKQKSYDKFMNELSETNPNNNEIGKDSNCDSPMCEFSEKENLMDSSLPNAKDELYKEAKEDMGEEQTIEKN